MLSESDKNAYYCDCCRMPKEDFLKEIERIQFILENHDNPIFRVGITLIDRMKAEEKKNILSVVAEDRDPGGEGEII